MAWTNEELEKLRKDWMGMSMYDLDDSVLTARAINILIAEVIELGHRLEGLEKQLARK